MTTARYATALTGGTAGALDAKAIATLADGDIAWVATGTTLYVYKFDAAATDAESSPGAIRPDDYTTAGVWKLQTVSQATGVKAIQVFTSSGTYNKTAGATVAVVEVVGGGGGGGGSQASASGSGGSAGGYARKMISLAGVTSETVTIGAAGSGATGYTDGTAGATTSFGAHVSATGGGKGKANAASDVGGTGVGGDINVQGGRGRWGGNMSGGRSFYGDGGGYVHSTTTAAPTGYGAGGSGCSSGTPANGTDGAAGICIVTEY